MYEYECALSGVTATGAMADDCDDLDDLPVGWTRVHIRRRQYNPRWLMIQQVKENMLNGILNQLPPEVAEAQQMSALVQVQAQLHALEKDTPMYAPDIDEMVFISDNGEVVESFNELREMLGLDALGDEEEDEDDEEMDAPPRLGDQAAAPAQR